MKESFTEHTFDELRLNPLLLRAVRELGFGHTTPVQAEAIPLMLEGKDLIAQAQTGTGKTAAFGLPILENTDPDCREVQALILCPTRELAVQVANDIRSYASFTKGIKTLAVYGGQDITRQISALKGTQIVVGTPGRIMDHMRRHTLKLDHVRTVILDEADEMLDMGFREDMETILGSIPTKHQTAMYSATMPPAILELTDAFLSDPVTVKITGEELTIPSIEQYYYSVKREYKVQATLRLIAFHRYKKCMIFCNMKSTVDNLVSELQKEGCMAEALHGDLSQFLRDAAMKRFRENDSCVLVATDIAARGIDVGNVEAVINYDIPQEAEYYVHRIGRTGRAGKEGVSHTLVGSREFYKVRFIESVCHSQMTERSVPTPDEIRDSREFSALSEALDAAKKGKGDSLLLRVHEFCNTEKITPEELAAALLFLKVGKRKEEADIELPKKGERFKRTSEKRERKERTSSGEKAEREQKGEKLPKRKLDDWNWKKEKEENYRWGNYSVIESDYRAEEKKERRKVTPDKSYPTPKDKKENRSRSRKILKEAVKDVDAKGRPKKVRSADARGWAAPKKKGRT